MNFYPKNMPHVLRFMAKNDVKFLNQSKRVDVIFGHETSSYNQFWIENSELKFNNLERSYGVFSIFKQ